MTQRTLRRLAAPSAILAALALAVAVPAQARKPQAVFKATSHDFGKVKQGDVVSYEFTFRNEGSAPLVVERIETTCGCTAALVSERTIGPGKEGRIKATFDTRGYSGRLSRYLYLISNDAEKPRRELAVSADIQVPPSARIDIDRYNVDMGIVLEGEAPATKIMILAEGEAANLLYVALTRAKQALIVSGDADRNEWLARIGEAWTHIDHTADLPAGAPAEPVPAASRTRMQAPAIGERRETEQKSETAAKGELFHACLERHAPPGTPRNLSALASKLGLDADTLAAIEAQARALIARPELNRFFNPARYRRACNELAILDSGGNARRIDRLVEFEEAIWILDYKTGDESAAMPEAALLAQHRLQLEAYVAAVAALHPGTPVHAALLLSTGKMLPVYLAD